MLRVFEGESGTLPLRNVEKSVVERGTLKELRLIASSEFRFVSATTRGTAKIAVTFDMSEERDLDVKATYVLTDGRSESHELRITSDQLCSTELRKRIESGPEKHEENVKGDEAHEFPMAREELNADEFTLEAIQKELDENNAALAIESDDELLDTISEAGDIEKKKSKKSWWGSKKSKKASKSELMEDDMPPPVMPSKEFSDCDTVDTDLRPDIAAAGPSSAASIDIASSLMAIETKVKNPPKKRWWGRAKSSRVTASKASEMPPNSLDVNSILPPRPVVARNSDSLDGFAPAASAGTAAAVRAALPAATAAAVRSARPMKSDSDRDSFSRPPVDCEAGGDGGKVAGEGGGVRAKKSSWWGKSSTARRSLSKKGVDSEAAMAAASVSGSADASAAGDTAPKP
mmetsp:Transcript_5037/g.12952  ORF Transcript_5037/g.12952 Transcript_5037/m.12952 type:complete len:403 (+) Transcript_5037:2632-3840(+)